MLINFPVVPYLRSLVYLSLWKGSSLTPCYQYVIHVWSRNQQSRHILCSNNGPGLNVNFSRFGSVIFPVKHPTLKYSNKILIVPFQFSKPGDTIHQLNKSLKCLSLELRAYRACTQRSKINESRLKVFEDFFKYFFFWKLRLSRSSKLTTSWYFSVSTPISGSFYHVYFGLLEIPWCWTRGGWKGKHKIEHS